MYTLKNLLLKSIEMKASDLHISEGMKPYVRVNGELIKIGEDDVNEKEVNNMVSAIVEYSKISCSLKNEIDTSYELKNQGRFRINIFKTRGRFAISARVIKNNILTLNEIKAPSILRDFTKENNGLILVTGSTGSGKSTTLASIIDEINKTRACHIITLEDPIEYTYKNSKSIINQREIGKDTENYEKGLNAALREDPDVILIGELRNSETIRTVLNAAETGHLVFSTLHTKGASEAVERIINMFPKEQQEEIRLQLSLVLKAVIYQKLIKICDNSDRIAAFEIMNVIPSVKNLIRKGKTYQIPSILQTGKEYGMLTMDMSILRLYKEGYINKDDALLNSNDKSYINSIFR